jgi:hypothetical protein
MQKGTKMLHEDKNFFIGEAEAEAEAEAERLICYGGATQRSGENKKA